MASITSIADFHSHCAPHSHVSFDLFDTLIRRRFLKVNEVHDTVSAYALALVGRRNDSSPFELTQLRYRMSDALKSFDGTGTQEPTVGQVWDRILAKHVPDDAKRAPIVRRVADFELAIELDNLGLIEGARDLLLRLRADGKVVTAISDMYFDMAAMRQILSKLEILDLFDHVYVSADSRLTKQTGDLFCKVLDDLGLQPRELLHVGDNRHADIAMSAEVGMSSVLVEQHHLVELERPAYGRRPRIEQEVADVVKVHLASILFDAADRQIDHLYFLARDGCAINAFLDRWRHPLIEAFLPPPPHSDMYMNRILACWGGIDFAGDWLIQAIGLVFWLNHGEATAQEMCARLGIDEVPAAFGMEILRADKDTFRTAEILVAAGHKDAIRAEILHKRAQLLRNLRDVGLFDHRRVTFSDVGYSGTVLRDLNALFVDVAGRDATFDPPAMHLHLVSTNANYAPNAARSYPFVQFSPQVVLPCDKLPEDLQASYAWLEFFFKHRTLKPILRLVERDGGLFPELRHDEPDANPIPTDRVLAFAQPREDDIILLWMAAVNYQTPLSGPVIERFANPDADTIAQMEDEVFELHSVQGARRSIILRVPGGREEAIALAAREGDYWIPGSIAASQAAGQELAPGPVSAPSMPRGGQAAGRLLRLIRGKRIAADAPPLEKARGFDPRFYRRFYPDLRHLRSDEALWQHYFLHGRRENRFASHEALETQLVAECGPIPADFNPDGYLRLNPDLVGHADTPERALDHYMRNGKEEGRRYSKVHHDLGREFDVLRARGDVVLSAEEAKRCAHGASVADLFLQRHGIRQGPWIDELDVAEFRSLHSGWAGAVQDKAECIVALLERGLDRCPALSLSAIFDPEFYRAQLPAHAADTPRSDTELYRHYLAQGSQRGIAPSEAAALLRVWGLPDFPEGFDWQGFAPVAGLATENAPRFEILRQFADTPGLDRLRFVSGDKAGRLISFLAARAWHVHARHDEARKLYEAALALPGNAGAIHHELGDLAMRTGRRGDALKHFRKAVETSTPDRWSYINLANILVDQGDHATALTILSQCEALWQQRAPWRRARDRACHARSRTVLRAIARDAGPSTLAAADELFADLAGMLPSSNCSAWRDTGQGVLLLSMRAASTAPRDRTLTGPVTAFSLQDPAQDDYLTAMLTHGTVIFHEVPFTAAVLRAIATARSLGRRTVAWVGDLTRWDGHALDRCQWAEDGADRSPLNLKQFADILLPARYCDEVITTLAGCVPFLSRIAADGEVRQLALPYPASSAFAPSSAGRMVLVMPLPDVDADDVRHLAGALQAAAHSDQQLHFLIDARLSETQEMRAIAGRWARLGDDPSLTVLADAIAVSDLVVQVVRNPAQQYAAWKEAETRGVPALVLRASPHSRASGALNAGGQSSIDDADLSASVSAPVPLSDVAQVEAQILARVREPRRAPAPPLSPALEHAPKAAPAHAPAGAASSGRQRILFANVFFAPQVIGGATRVLVDNLDYYLDHHADAFDFGVFCADEQNEHSGEWRLDSYRGIPVFRIATPQEVNMDWRADNAMTGARFAAVLRAFQPDLVHIHCLQRLGVVLAEACRAMNIPYVITLHDAWWLSDYPFLTDEDGRPVEVEQDYRCQAILPNVAPEVSLLRAGRLRQALLGARECLAVSETFARLYRDCGIPARVIENGSSRIDAQPRFQPDDERVHLCHVGGLEHHKGAYLVEAALRSHAYANLHITVVDLARGPGEETHTVWGTTPVTITGKMSTEEVARFYARMNVLLAPSTWPESYGLVTREALAHGLWVVAGNRGAIGDAVEQGVNGFVVPVDDACGIATALTTIDGDARRYRASPAAPRALRLADEQSAELVALYRSILSDVSEPLEHAPAIS